MFTNYLKVTLRNLLRSRLYACINLVGLAIGLASVILLGLYVQYELSYDDHYADSDRLYRVSREIFRDGMQDVRLPTAPPIAAELLEQDFPEVEATTRMYALRALIGNEDVAFYEDGVRYVDPNFFELFDAEWLQGDLNALQERTAVVLTRSTAQRYFGTEDPIGQTLLIENRAPVTVRGVIADLPQNTHLSGDVFVPLQNYLNIFPEDVRNGWNANLVFTYVRLAPGADPDVLRAGFPNFLDRHVAADAHTWTSLTAMKVSDIHLRSSLPIELQPGGSLTTVLTLITVAAGILLIACCNFMNLATARSTLRSKEVGVRKTIGSNRRQLVLQFLGESIGMTLLATLLAIVLVELVMPAFVAFTGKDLVFDPLHDRGLQALLGALVLVVGLVAGSYPAFYLASFKPAQVMRAKAGNAPGDLVFRNLLVILQFAISIALVIATSVVFLQTRYARNFDAGFDREQVILLGGAPSQGLTDRWGTLRDELLRTPGVLNVTASNMPPGNVNLNNVELRVEGGVEGINVPPMVVDYDFFATYDIALVAGRVFSPDFPADAVTQPADPGGKATGNFVLNASAARQLGWTPEAALGRQVEFTLFPGTPPSTGRIVGVVADSNFESIRSNLKPMLFIAVPSGFYSGIPVLNTASVRIGGGDASATLAAIDQAWKNVIPEFPVNRAFLSDRFDALYQGDVRLGQMYSSFAALAILIACLGLYGLATFNTQRRRCEIGIRKVMGGSVLSIVLLLTNDFSKLVLIANLIAWPVAYVAMQRWLENFAYRIDLTPMIFIGSGLIALCIAWVTVGGTAAKAAAQKPVLALRYE